MYDQKIRFWSYLNTTYNAICSFNDAWRSSGFASTLHHFQISSCASVVIVDYEICQAQQSTKPCNSNMAILGLFFLPFLHHPFSQCGEALCLLVQFLTTFQLFETTDFFFFLLWPQLCKQNWHAQKKPVRKACVCCRQACYMP